MDIIREIQTEKRLYKLAETMIGQILFYEFGDYVQYRNVTQHDIFWSIAKKFDFLVKFNGKAVEVFKSDRLTNVEKVSQIKSGDCVYHLVRKKPYDGYLYEINATTQRFSKQSVYTRYYEPAIQTLDQVSIERLKVEEIIKWNKQDSYDVSGVSDITAEVYRLVKDAPSYNAIVNPLAARTNYEEMEQLSLFN